MKNRAYPWVLFLSAALFVGSIAQAAPEASSSLTHKMYFKNEDILKVIEFYSKISSQKIIVDSSVRGKVSIFIQEPISADEAFNHLSSALALNGYGFVRKGDTLEVRSARNLQRDLHEIKTELPALKPERIVTYVYSPKFVSVENINRDLRIMSSKDGEMAVHPSTNQIIFTDWVSNIHRIEAIMKEVDKPAVAKK
jgi:general secretion pathway protein D